MGTNGNDNKNDAPHGHPQGVHGPLEESLLKWAERRSDPETAQDFLQEMRMAVYERLFEIVETARERSERGSSFWGEFEKIVRRILRNKWVDWRRRQRCWREYLECVGAEQHQSEVPLRNRSPGEIVALKEEQQRAQEMLERIPDALARLAEPHRTAMHLRYRENRTYAEIATIMGVSTTYVGVLLHRSREMLRRQLGGEHQRESA